MGIEISKMLFHFLLIPFVPRVKGVLTIGTKLDILSRNRIWVIPNILCICIYLYTMIKDCTLECNRMGGQKWFSHWIPSLATSATLYPKPV